MMTTELKPCPFCGSKNVSVQYLCFRPYVICEKCHAQIPCYNNYKKAKEAWNRRVPEIVKVETSFYDKEETFPDCTVQVLTNTVTGETSVGWWKNEV